MDSVEKLYAYFLTELYIKFLWVNNTSVIILSPSKMQIIFFLLYIMNLIGVYRLKN